jgi:hypothetical protein
MSQSFSNNQYLITPNPDKPEKIATKAPRHKGKRFIIIKLRAFVPSFLGGENILLDESFANMM